ncbi:hypothetical protein KI387_030473, partial [Taxus chinensis]
MVVRTDFVAVEEEQKEEADQQSVFSESSVHVGTLFEGNADSIQVAQSAIKEESSEEDLAVPTCPLEQQIEEFDLTNFMLEEEFNREQDCLQILEEGEAALDIDQEEHILDDGGENCRSKGFEHKAGYRRTFSSYFYFTSL